MQAKILIIDDSTTIRFQVRQSLEAENEYQFPIPNDSYDIVVSGQVLEHVRKPWVWMKEVGRVCKPGGIAITIIPASWPYHEAPVDCWRAYPEGMKALYEDSGFVPTLSVFECLETSYRKIPGRSCVDGTVKKTLARRLHTSIFGLLGLPIECAFDTIAIGVKK